MCNQEKIFTFLLLILLVSCNNKKNNFGTLTNEGIEIIFWKGKIEFTHRQTCDSFIKWAKYPYDTIYIGNKIYKDIENHFKNLTPYSNDRYSDFRIHIKIDSSQYCINEFNSIVKNNIKMHSDDTLVYLIKDKSNYYNYFTIENLKKFEEIQKFGIPKEYSFKAMKLQDDQVSRVVLIPQR